MEEPGLVLATDFQLSECRLFAASGQSVDLFGGLVEMNVFEDLFSSTMTGNILVGDTNNLINMLPITGFEYLVLGFRKSSDDASFSKVFRVYKVESRKKENLQTEVYLINFCSEEVIVDRSTLVSKTYTGQSISKIVQDIGKKYLKIPSDKMPTDHVKETFGSHNLIIPNWHPFDTIRYLSNIATSTKYPSSSFVFYETYDGFYFTTIEELMTADPIQNVTVSPRNLGFESNPQESDIEMSFESAFEYEINTDFDVLNSIRSGMYASKLITVDPLRQRIQQTTLDLTSFFDKTKHLNENPCVSSLTTRSGKPLNKLPDAFLRVYPTTLGHDKLKSEYHENQVEKWLLQRTMALANLNANKFNITLPGNFKLQVGKVLDIFFPALEMADKTEKPLDELHSGKYLITAIRHAFNKYQHSSYLEVARDSSKAKYPEGLNTSAGMETLKTS